MEVSTVNVTMDLTCRVMADHAEVMKVITSKFHLESRMIQFDSISEPRG